MLKRRRERVRRAVMWAAGAVLVVSVAAWVASLWAITWAPTSPGISVGLVRGFFWLHNLGPFRGAGLHSVGWDWPPDWWFEDIGFFETRRFSTGLGWSLYVPIWMAAAVSGALLVGAYWNNRRHARSSVGHCPTCGYDLTGIDGVCPECGGAS
ncbi:MAG: hypothetical protein HND58_17355 [Planctomycetota bacterium]|nr:MAG: hypothetical protein HND58_17355 [Planctomycetota bacterium]